MDTFNVSHVGRYLVISHSGSVILFCKIQWLIILMVNVFPCACHPYIISREMSVPVFCLFWGCFLLFLLLALESSLCIVYERFLSIFAVSLIHRLLFNFLHGIWHRTNFNYNRVLPDAVLELCNARYSSVWGMSFVSSQPSRAVTLSYLLLAKNPRMM